MQTRREFLRNIGIIGLTGLIPSYSSGEEASPLSILQKTNPSISGKKNFCYELAGEIGNDYLKIRVRNSETKIISSINRSRKGGFLNGAKYYISFIGGKEEFEGTIRGGEIRYTKNTNQSKTSSHRFLNELDFKNPATIEIYQKSLDYALEEKGKISFEDFKIVDGLFQKVFEDYSLLNISFRKKEHKEGINLKRINSSLSDLEKNVNSQRKTPLAIQLLKIF
jgi:hypothetical protein